MSVRSLHHAQITIPPGCEEEARAFYVDRLGLTTAYHAIYADVPLPGMTRCELRDPFGNRIELIEPDEGVDQ